MTRDQELWGVTTGLLKRHGGDTPRHVAEMVGNAAILGDAVGLALWREIAGRLQRITVAAEVAQ